MNNSDFAKQVMRVSRILSAVSVDSDSITQEAMDAASTALLNEEDLSDNDRFLIASAAKQLLESSFEPIDLDSAKKYRGYVVVDGVGRQVTDSAQGEC
mgnify:CR=1 FL=1|jgi:hypothetical protein